MAGHDELEILERHPGPVPLDKWAVLFVTAESRHNEPNWCGNCHMMWKRQRTCAIHGPKIVIAPVTKKGRKYVPICGVHDYGKAMDEPKAMYPAKNDPNLSGLEWVRGDGTNCGGVNGGRSCSKHYFKEDKESGFCRVLQEVVQAGDCCAANESTNPADSIGWEEAQALLKKEEGNGNG